MLGAASASRAGTARQAGTNTLAINGNAASVCAIATNHHAARQSYHDSSKVTMSPSPSVTGEIASGSTVMASIVRPYRGSRTTPSAAAPANTVPSRAVSSAVRNDATTESNNDSLKTLRQASSDTASPT